MGFLPFWRRRVEGASLGRKGAASRDQGVPSLSLYLSRQPLDGGRVVVVVVVGELG